MKLSAPVLTDQLWRAIADRDFEQLALQHVCALYPDASWLITSEKNDGGRDAVGEYINVRTGVRELYWMEAKNRPSRHLGAYTLAPHLFAVFVARDVKLLHVVMSTDISMPFLMRAREFAAEHGFGFAYTDADTLAAWLHTRRDLLRLFGDAEEQVANALDARADVTRLDVFASAFIVPENDTVRRAVEPVDEIVPGRKYALVIALARARALPSEALPLKVYWHPDPRTIGVIRRRPAAPIATIRDVTEQSLVIVPFRLLRYDRRPVAAPRIEREDGQPDVEVPLRAPAVLDRLGVPFSGAEAFRLLRRRTKTLREAAHGEARLICLVGPAGTGKTRLAEELRDEAHRQQFDVRLVRMAVTAASQEQQWQTLFRWMFGLEHNVFGFEERPLIDRRLSRVDPTVSDDFRERLNAFLLAGEFDPALFDPGDRAGGAMSRCVSRIVGRWAGRTLIHLDDAHHLTERTIAPLRLFHHIAASWDDLSLAMIITARNDETVLQPAIGFFLDEVRRHEIQTTTYDEVPPMTPADARELVAQTLLLPELRVSHSALADRILDRAGTHPFTLTQLLEHIAVDYGAVAFGRTTETFVVDVDALKRALEDIPERVANILQLRFKALRRTAAGRARLEILAAAALIGREAEIPLVEAALGSRVDAADLREMQRYGYTRPATEERLALVHDLLVDALLQDDAAEAVAARAAERLNERPLAELDAYRRARIYYRAGPDYHDECWETAEAGVRAAHDTEDHQLVKNLARLLAEIHADVPRRDLATDVRFASASAEQHCGNSRAAFGQFEKIVRDASVRLPGDRAAWSEFIEASVQCGNQAYLQLRLAQAQEHMGSALAALSDPHYLGPDEEQASLRAFAHNRLGAVFLLAGDLASAEREYTSSLQHSSVRYNATLLSHTFQDLACCHRFRDAGRVAEYLHRSREVAELHAPGKERRRVQLATSEAYSAALATNDHFHRKLVYASAYSALQRGYVYQTAEALLACAYCSIIADRPEEAREVLLSALSLSEIAEDARSHFFALHYLSVATSPSDPRSQDYAEHALRIVSADPVARLSRLGVVAAANGQRLESGLRAEAIPYELV